MFSKYSYVYSVYKEKSFTKAAEKLYISQPSLSAAIKKIEEKLGSPLFERGIGGVTLTDVGKEYIFACEKIINTENEFKTKLDDLNNLETGNIVVGGTNYLSCYFIPQIINRFKELYPKITITLIEANSVTLEKMLKNERVDIIIDSFVDLSENYIGFPLCKERIMLCVPSQYQENLKYKAKKIEPSDLLNKNTAWKNIPPVKVGDFSAFDFILLKKGNDMRTRTDMIFEENKISPNISFQVDQLNISLALSVSGLGVTFVTDTLIRHSKTSDNITLYNIEKHNSRTLYVAHKKNKYCSSAMKKFIELAKDLI